MRAQPHMGAVALRRGFSRGTNPARGILSSPCVLPDQADILEISDQISQTLAAVSRRLSVIRQLASWPLSGRLRPNHPSVLLRLPKRFRSCVPLLLPALAVRLCYPLSRSAFATRLCCPPLLPALASFLKQPRRDGGGSAQRHPSTPQGEPSITAMVFTQP